MCGCMCVCVYTSDVWVYAYKCVCVVYRCKRERKKEREGDRCLKVVLYLERSLHDLVKTSLTLILHPLDKPTSLHLLQCVSE